jgi:purine-nucleoside phosphorylase
VLGSGLASLEAMVEEPIAVPFETLPGLVAAGVQGHGGRFVLGRLGGASVVVQSGRYHPYEGHAADIVGAPVRAMARLGVSAVLMTNAVGGIHPMLRPGDLVLIDDQINLSFRAPLGGAVKPGEDRFPDMSSPFSQRLTAVARSAAARLRIPLREGVYAGVLGPSYETRAEVRMLERLGADVVGMSTVSEVIVAAAVGLDALCLSLVTNRATGTGGLVSHEDVLELGRTAGEACADLVAEIVHDVAANLQSTETK